LFRSPYDNAYVEQYSKDNKEPEWMTALRLEALDYANELDLPRPDKSNVTHWNFTTFKHTAEAEEITDLTQAPATIQDFIDKENLDRKIVILRNQRVAYSDRKSVV